MRPERFGRENVSRETLSKLEYFAQLVRKWTPQINLVSKHDMRDLWERHIWDSAQIVGLSDSTRHWVDIGSGGGFPGIVVAIILNERPTESRVTLIESDKRKCAFLGTVKRSLHLPVEILPARIEDLSPIHATTISARALAPLDSLICHASRHLDHDGVALFPKGKGWRNELSQAKEKWSFDCDVVESTTDSDAAILRIRKIQKT